MPKPPTSPVVKLAVCAAAAGLGYLINSVPLSLGFGLDILLGGIFGFLIARLWGPVWGVLVAAASAAYTISLWGHPFAVVGFTMEVAAVWYISRRYDWSVAFADICYWLLFGGPWVAFTYGSLLHMDALPLLLVVLKQSFNGILVAVMADLAWTVLAVASHTKSATFGLRHGLVSLLAFCTSLGILASVVVASRNDVQLVEEMASRDLQAMAAEYRKRIAVGVSEFRNPVPPPGGGATFHLDEERRLLAQTADGRFVVGHIDPSSDQPAFASISRRAVQTMLTSPAVQKAQIELKVNGAVAIGAQTQACPTDSDQRPLETKGLPGYRLVPKVKGITLVQRWSMSCLVIETALDLDRRIVLSVSIPLQQYVQTMREGQGVTLIVALTALIGAVLLGSAAGRLLLGPLQRLTDMVDRLPHELAAGRKVPFGHSCLREVQVLSQSFDRMTDELALQMRENEHARERLEVLAYEAPLAVFFLSRSGNEWGLDYHSANFAEVFPSVGSPQRAAWAKVIHPDDLAAWEQLPDRLATKGRYAHEYRIADGKQNWRWVLEQVATLQTKPDEAVGFWLDVTEMRATQQQLAHSTKLATIGELVTGMAHEINQPLNVIRLASQNAVRALPDSAAVLPRLASIDRQVDRMSEIISRLRDFAHPLSDVDDQCDVQAAVNEAVAMLRDQFAAKDIRIDLTMPDDPLLIRGSGSKLQQVLLNLLLNARDAVLARPAADPTPSLITVLVTENADSGCEIAVKDNGCGIAPEDMARLFDPFFTTKEVGNGTGLGLSISYGLIKSMGGQISARNRSPGAEFLVSLPVLAHA